MNHPTITTLDNVGGHSFAGERRDSVRVFRRAMRHSRLVRVLRVAVPAGLMVAVGGLALATWFEPLRVLGRLPVSADRLVVSGTKITMAAPKLSGFTRDSRKYDLAARAATQDVTNPDLLELEDVTADFEAPDKTAVKLTATDGRFDRKTGLLTLHRNVLLVSSNGYRVRLNEVRVETGSGNITTDQPVQVDMLQGTLNAKRLEVLKSGEVLNFDGGVKMRLLMNDQPPASDKPNKP